MAKNPESRLQLKIQKAIASKFKDAWIFKVWGGPFQQAGIPDLVGCVNGRFIALEVKVPGKKATKLQEWTIEKIGKAGGIAAVVTSTDEAIEVITDGLG